MSQQRLYSIGAGALMVNSLLFVLMERMSAQEPVILIVPPAALAIDFVRLKKEPEPPKIKPREKPPEQKQQQPDLLPPDVSVPRPQPLRVREINMNMPHLDLAMNISGVPFSGEMAMGSFSGLSEAIPLVRTAPLYPPNALSRRIEGRVKILFTVTEDGGVMAPKVIQADPPNVFDSSALRAIRKWKFRKKIVDGKPVSWQSVQTIIFKLER
ncbi:MAG: TonB family protein [Gammaproteobacteria bacterium]